MSKIVREWRMIKGNNDSDLDASQALIHEALALLIDKYKPANSHGVCGVVVIEDIASEPMVVYQSNGKFVAESISIAPQDLKPGEIVEVKEK